MQQNIALKSQNRKKENTKEKKKLHYSMLTLVLLLCIIELTVSAMQNINKNINFTSKIKGLEQKRNEELHKNEQLKSEISNFNSEVTLESIARNNLKMAGKDEILVIMSRPPKTEEDNEVLVNNKKLINFDFIHKSR